MILGIEWYWWIIMLTALGISIPFKVKFMRWLDRRRREKKERRQGKWGDGE